MAEISNEVKIETLRDNSDVTIRCEGAMDLHNYKEFQKALEEASGVAESLMVDFVLVDYIDTAVLGALAVAANKMIARGKRLELKVAEPSHPLRTMQITGFTAIMDITSVPKQ